MATGKTMTVNEERSADPIVTTATEALVAITNTAGRDLKIQTHQKAMMKATMSIGDKSAKRSIGETTGSQDCCFVEDWLAQSVLSFALNHSFEI